MNEFPELTLNDLVEIDTIIEHQMRTITDLNVTVFFWSKPPVLQQRRKELAELQQRVRNTRIAMLDRGER